MTCLEKAWKEFKKTDLEKDGKKPTKQDLIYYLCPVNFNLPDNKDCNCMPQDWETECTKCWNKELI